MIRHEYSLKSKGTEHQTQAGLLLSSLTLCDSAAIPLGLGWESVDSINSPNWAAGALRWMDGSKQSLRSVLEDVALVFADNCKVLETAL